MSTSAAASAAPSATAFFGCTSTETGHPSSRLTRSATSGIRDDPPTRTTAWRSLGATWADLSARLRASID